MYSEIENATDDLMEYLGLEDPIEQNPLVEVFPGENGVPGHLSETSGEYSRYAIVDMIRTTAENGLYLSTDTRPRSPVVQLGDGLNPPGYQWKTFQETG